MRTLTLTAFAAIGLAFLALPAAAVPAGPVSGISEPSDVITLARMRSHRMRRSKMTWVQRSRGRH